MDVEVLTVLLKALARHGVRYIIVGGTAVNLHGLLRATEDVDIFVAPQPENIEQLKAALRDVWHDPEIELICAEDLAGDYPSVRYGPPDGGLYLDILTRLGEAFTYDTLESEQLQFEGVPVIVATPRQLVAMKSVTRRPRDHADAAALVEKFKLEEP